MKIKSIYKSIPVIVLLALIAVFFYLHPGLFHALKDGNSAQIKELLTNNVFEMYLFMLGVMIIQNTFTLIPLILIITINMSLFGVSAGFLWSWFSSVFGASLIFLAVRYIFQSFLSKRLKPELIAKLEKKGFLYVLEARILPFFPTSLVNFMAGVSTISFYKFLSGTIVGNLGYFLALALVPAGMVSLNISTDVIWGVMIAAIIVYAAVKILLSRRNREKKNDSAM